MAAEKTDYAFLLPEPDADSAPYWEAARRHELVVQRCSGCSQLRHPPRLVCPYCLAEGSEWTRVSGRGTVYTFVRIAHAVLPQWRGQPPYNVAQIALEEDPRVRITGNVVDADKGAQSGPQSDPRSGLRCGLPVQVMFDDVTDDTTLPRWRATS
jgi:uncharacterized OB-fold protein